MYVPLNTSTVFELALSSQLLLGCVTVYAPTGLPTLNKQIYTKLEAQNHVCKHDINVM